MMAYGVSEYEKAKSITKKLENIINKAVKKYKPISAKQEGFCRKWYYDGRDAVWTNMHSIIKIKGLANAPHKGFTDSLKMNIVGDDDPCFNALVEFNQKAYDDKVQAGIAQKWEDIYLKEIPKKMDEITRLDAVKIPIIHWDVDRKEIDACDITYKNGWCVFKDVRNTFYAPLDDDYEASCTYWPYQLFEKISDLVPGATLYTKGKTLYFTACIAGPIQIEIVTATLYKDYTDTIKTPDFIATDKKETDDDYADEVYAETQVNEEPAEALNDIQETDSNDKPESDPLETIKRYLLNKKCVYASNGSGGLNIECNYENRQIVKDIGAIWSPRYYHWYIPQNRLAASAKRIDIINETGMTNKGV